MNKKIITLSDTSHPFITYVDESDGTDNTDRILTTLEFAAIRAFQSNWGYVGNHDISDDLVDMLADETTPTNTLINRIMRKWDLSGPGYDGIRTDLENLFILRTTVHFLPNEVKALESLEGEKSDNWIDEAEKENNARIWQARKELFKEESDKRVTRYFIGQTGWAWFVHFIVDMPEQFDDSLPNRSKAMYRAKDGMTTLHMTSLFMSEEKAWQYVNEDIAFKTRFDDGTLTHVYNLNEI